MVIDSMEMRHTATAHTYQFLDTAASAVSGLSFIDIAVGVTAFVGILGVYEWHRRWTKGKGLRMALEQERLRIRELLTEGINDLILDWEVKGKVSTKEGDTLYNELSKKLDLPDLIPTHRRAKIIKEEIKRRQKSTEPAFVKARQKVHIPGGMPVVATKQKFKQTTGTLLKFWKKA